jgi:hypothetical protein
LTNDLPVSAGSMPCAVSHSQEFGIPTSRYASLKHRTRMKFVRICSLPPFTHAVLVHATSTKMRTHLGKNSRAYHDTANFDFFAKHHHSVYHYHNSFLFSDLC